MGGGWGIAAIRAFTTHLNEWIFRAFRICILMEPVARCSCFSKQKHWQFYWVYFLRQCLLWAKALETAVGTFCLVAIDGLAL